MAAERLDEGARALVTQALRDLGDRSLLREQLQRPHQPELGPPGSEGELRLAPERSRQRARTRARAPGPRGERALVGGVAPEQRGESREMVALRARQGQRPDAAGGGG